MNKLLQERLYTAYPKIFIEKDLPATESCMHWGICCDDGWFELISTLCYILQKFSDQESTQVIALQVKEKFAGLKFYFQCDKHRDVIFETINIFEGISYKTCEVTGGHGFLHKRGGTYKTLCRESGILLGFKPVETSDPFYKVMQPL